MLALFSKKVVNAPSELDAPACESPDGRRSAAATLETYRKAHPLATVLQFDDVTAFAFSHDDQELLRPRLAPTLRFEILFLPDLARGWGAHVVASCWSRSFLAAA